MLLLLLNFSNTLTHNFCVWNNSYHYVFTKCYLNLNLGLCRPRKVQAGASHHHCDHIHSLVPYTCSRDWHCAFRWPSRPSSRKWWNVPLCSAFAAYNAFINPCRSSITLFFLLFCLAGWLRRLFLEMFSCCPLCFIFSVKIVHLLCIAEGCASILKGVFSTCRSCSSIEGGKWDRSVCHSFLGAYIFHFLYRTLADSVQAMM